MQIRLGDDGWVQPLPGVWTRGAAFSGVRLLDADALARLFVGAQDADSAVRLALSLTGHFAVVREGSEGFALVDASRSYPLFFLERAGSLTVSDAPNLALGPGDSAEPMKAALVDFAYCGVVTGSNTLVGQVKQIPAGWILSWKTGREGAPRSSLAPYDIFIPRLRGGWSASDAELHDAFLAVMDRAVDRLIEYAAGRTIALPLSAGYDSRLIAMLLSSKDYDSVVAFSYGKKGNAEAEVSRAIAAELGFRWEFLGFDERRWSEWAKSQDWHDYVDFAHRGVSLPLMQGWASVQELASQALVPEGAVFTPGLLGGGVAAGLRTVNDAESGAPADELRVAARIIREQFSLWWEQPARRRDLAGAPERVAAALKEVNPSGYEADAVAYESFVRQEATYKFVGNGVRAYEHTGYDWWLPFADRAHADFWMAVPYEKRLDSTLYEAIVTREVPDRLGMLDNSLVRRLKVVRPARSSTYRALRWAFRRSGIKEPFSRMQKRLAAASKPKEEVYNSHPLGWWGAVDPGSFNAQYSGLENIYSFMSQELLLDRYGWRRGS